MTDLDRDLRDGLAAVSLDAAALGDRVVEFQSRVKWRRARRRAGVVGALAMLMVAVAVTTAARLQDKTEAIVAGPSEPAVLVPPVAAAKAFDPGPVLRPEDARLPAEGIAAFVEGVGVVLVDLDGHVLGHLPGFDYWRGPGPPGPLLISADQRWYLIDGGRIRPTASVDGWMASPLAYGAELASYVDADPGGNEVRRNGRRIFDMGNGMDSDSMVSNDLDVVSVEWFDQPAGKANRALDLRSGRTWTLPAGCVVADRHGSRRYLLCGDGVGGIRRTVRAGKDTDLSPSVLVRPPDAAGQWSSAMVSPDGRRLLLGWWKSCVGYEAYFAPASTGELAPVERSLGSDLTGTPIVPLGWSLDATAYVGVLENDTCGPPAAVAPGVYAIREGRAAALVLPLPPGVGLLNVAVWAPALR